MKNLIIFGIDDYPEVACYLFTKDSDYNVVAFTVDKNYCTVDEFCGKPVIPFENIESVYPPNEYDMFIAIGYSGINSLREKKYLEAKLKGYKLATYISSKATVWDTLKIGDNCLVLEHNNIQPFATIGNNVVLWSGNHIGHHVTIGNNTFITSHVVISGRCVIDDNCFIGVNATINDHVHIRYGSVIGSGALITRDTEDNSVYKAQYTIKHEAKSSNLKYFK